MPSQGAPEWLAFLSFSDWNHCLISWRFYIELFLSFNFLKSKAA